MPFIQVRDINMQYQIYEADPKSTADTLVLIHGVGLSTDLWEPMIPFLIQNYRIVTLDLRGHGETERGIEEIKWSTFIEDLNRLFELLHLQSVHFVGHGFGANLAIKYSILFGEKVKRVVCISLPAYYPKKTAATLIEGRKNMTSGGSMLALAQTMAKGITNELNDSMIFQKVVNAYCKTSPNTYFQIFDLFLNEPPFDDISLLSHPTLSMVGDQDPLYITSNTLTSKLLKNSRLLIVPKSSNATFIDQPSLTAEWIHDFLNSPIEHRVSYLNIENEESAEEVMEYFFDIVEEGINKLEAANTIQVDILSSFKVIINGTEKMDGWNQRYAKSLFLFLTFNQTTTREQICDALFPEVPLKQAMKNLKVYLNYLKRLVEVEDGVQPILMMDKEHVALRGSIRSDVIKLKNDLRKIQIEDNPLLKKKLCKEILSSLPDTLLPGLYDDWIISYRSDLENQIVELVKEVADLEEEQGNFQESVSLINVALKYQPENEWLYDRSINLYKKMKQAMSKKRGISSN